LLGSSSSGSSANIPSHVNFPIYDATFDATWEIGVFGGKRRRIEQAQAQANARVQLAAEVGQAYVNLRDAQHRLALQQRSATLEQQTLTLTEQRVGQGATSQVDIDRLQTQLKMTESQIPTIQSN